MKRARHDPEQIVAVLRQAEASTPVAELCRQAGITEGTFYRWKKEVAAGQSDSVCV